MLQHYHGLNPCSVYMAHFLDFAACSVFPIISLCSALPSVLWGLKYYTSQNVLHPHRCGSVTTCQCFALGLIACTMHKLAHVRLNNEALVCPALGQIMASCVARHVFLSLVSDFIPVLWFLGFFPCFS